MTKRISEEMRMNHNRAMVLLIIALITSSWVMINAGELLASGILYIVLSAVSIFLYIVWSKF